MTDRRGMVLADDLLPTPVTPSARVPEPSFLQGLGANVRTNFDDIRAVREGRLKQDYAPIVEAVADATGKSSWNYFRPLQALNPLDIDATDYDAVWRDIEALPAALRGKFPKSRVEFEKAVTTRGGERGDDLATASQTGIGSQLAGGVVASFASPVNAALTIATGGLGGAARTVLQRVLTESAVNIGGAAIELPGLADTRRIMGEQLSGEEVAMNLATAGLAPLAMHGAGRAAGAGARAIAGSTAGKAAGDALAGARESALAAAFPHLPEPIRRRWAAKGTIEGADLADAVEATVGRGNLSSDEAAAVTVARREAEVAQASPFVPDGAGVKAHQDRIGEAMRTILRDMPEPPRAPLAASTALTRGGTVGVGRGGTAHGAGSAPIDPTIVDFFVGKGWPVGQARGIAAGVAAESANAPGARNATSGALGLGQWLGSRKAELIRRYGPTPTREQQLEFLHWELSGGDHGGAAVRAAGNEATALDAYVRRFMRPAAGMETSGDLRRGMAALGRESEGMPARTGEVGDPVTGGVSDAQAAALRAEGGQLAADRSRPAEPVDELPPPTVGPTLKIETEAGDRIIADGLPPMTMARIPASRVSIDAGLMQFKAGGDAFGVNDRLKGVTEWNPAFAGRVILWERADGTLLVADGHQRVGLAKRIGATKGRDVPLDALVLHESDGVSAGEVRRLAALKNISEGTGSAVDAAKVIREAGREKVLAMLPPRSALVRDADGLARLSDSAFGAVVNDVVPPEHAAAIGRLLPDDPKAHDAMVDLLARAGPATQAQAESIIRQGIAAGFVDGVQTDMFGSIDTMASLFLDRAKVLDRALGRLRKLKSVFTIAAREADTLEAGGNRIDATRSRQEALTNDQAIDLVQRLANSAGPIKDAIDGAARRLAGGEPIARVVDDLVDDLRGIDLGHAILDGADAGARDLAGSTDDLAARHGPVEPGPVDTATIDMFADPVGPAARQQLDSLEHDLRADPAVAERRRQEAALKAASPMQAAADQDSTIGSPLFDAADQQGFRLDMEGEPTTLGELMRAVDEEKAAIDATRACLPPAKGDGE